MKPFTKQFLMSGGFYFIISYFFSFFENNYIQILNWFLLFGLVVVITLLLFKKSFCFLDQFHQKHPKVSLYMIVLGFIEYLGMILIGIPGGIYGYKAAMAQYKGKEYVSFIPEYLRYVSLFYLVLLIFALLWATYVNFIKIRKVNK